MSDGLWNQRKTAEYLEFSESWLTKMRMRGLGPPYVKMSSGNRGRIRYRESDLQKYIESRLKGEES